MGRLQNIKANRYQRQIRVRSTICGDEVRPRLCVHISSKYIRAQVINDKQGQTLVFVSTLKRKTQESLVKQASWVGQEIAIRCKKLKIEKVVFDRRWRSYRGRLDALAQAARKQGLKF